VDVNDGSILSVTRHVEGNVEKRGDGPFTVAAGIVHEEGFDHIFGVNASDKRMCDLMRLAGGQRIDPKIAGSGRTVVIVEKA
jgi:hypothetical protein